LPGGGQPGEEKILRCDDTLTIPEGGHCILQHFMEAVFVIYII
jgi:hypothetical protein